jgi:hypothetical protein
MRDAIPYLLVAIAIIAGEVRVNHERKRFIEERDAWAGAAAKEREQLIRHAADERAAYINSIAQQPALIPAPWPETTNDKLYVSEDDEITGANQRPENIEDELAKRGLVDAA